ncbi:diguanylate cyclase (GGDEF)-like protein [Rhodanobacter sp. K2T2]|uniref:GGDEF domain-containing protein n=1 Tax=Rhodanobacter sp. K2T2 TaxID=2723085 RepID=UPI0015CC56AD|nr:diguanylate cyclase [Rhodanobacter sp. K2T2]NYE27581.1 diguanylate cyclase (GGDEF)-like protein [Rhodanobacter sp. K2T2]
MDAERAIARRLTYAYIAGLALIAILSGAVHVLLNNVIVAQGDSATVINVAGRQRMLSQRIGLLATDLHAGDATARQPLLDAVTLMERSEKALMQGGDLGIRHELSPSAHRFYLEGATPLDFAVRQFVLDARRFAQPLPGGDVEAAYRRLQAAARTTLLPNLNQAVSIFEDEASRRIEWLRTAQKVVLITLLITLSLEAIFIFRPLVDRVRRYAASLYELATRDSLTGLANRRHFMDVGNRELLLASRSGRPLSVAMLDLDHFKSVNDTYGHAVGDLVLKRFASLALATLRSSDIVGRIGGEEFALILREMSPFDASAVAEKLRVAAAADRSEGLPVFTVSIGISVANANDRSLDDVLRRADKALYAAKVEGRNRVAVALDD